MKKEALLKLRTPLRITLSVSLFAAAVCLMAACVGIWRSGHKPFSREAVAAAFGPIAIPIILCLVLVVISVVYELLLPCPAEKKAARQTRMLLKRMQARTDLELCNEELRSRVLSLRADRKLMDRIGRVLVVLSCILFLTYGTNPANFHSTHINASMIRAMYWLLPCSAVPFAYGYFAAGKNLSSMKEELDLLKSAPKESKIAPPRPKPHRKTLYIRAAFLVLALVFLIGGFFAGGTADVLTKAVNICTECVGLG